MDKDELIKQQQRDIKKYQTLLYDIELGLEATPKPEMALEEIMSSLMFLLKQDDIKSYRDLATLKVDLNKIPGNDNRFGFRNLFNKIETEIDEGDGPVVTIRLCFIDNYKNVITEIVRQARENRKVDGSISLNQGETLKISDEIKTSLEAIKVLHKLKFDYEAIQFLIGDFTKNLSADEKRRFSVLKDNL